MSKKTKEGREFELLIERIEKILAPKGAIIKSPDYIPDLITGSLREVDVSIRFQEESENRLITVECRDRTGQQDTTWIEQLVTKQKDIGAWRTYAVSTGKFSQPAIEKAKHYGIEIRQFDQITDAEIAQEWALKSSNLKLDIIAPECYLINLSVLDINKNEIHIDELTEEFKETLIGEFTDGFYLNEYLSKADINKILGQFVDPTTKTESVRVSVTLNYENEDLLAETVYGQKIVSQIISDYSFQNRIINVPFQSIQQYSSPQETIVQFIEAQANLDGNSIKANIRGRFKPISVSKTKSQRQKR